MNSASRSQPTKWRRSRPCPTSSAPSRPRLNDEDRGVSESFVANLNVDIPAELAGDFLSKLHYVSESIDEFSFVEGGRREIVFTLKKGAAADPVALGARLSEIARKITRSYRAGGGKVLVNRDLAVPFADDPHPLLEAKGELFRYGAGRYGFGPGVSELIDIFDRQL